MLQEVRRKETSSLDKEGCGGRLGHDLSWRTNRGFYIVILMSQFACKKVVHPILALHSQGRSPPLPGLQLGLPKAWQS